MSASHVNSVQPETPQLPGRANGDLDPIYVIAACLVVAATSWFLLTELRSLLRPVVLAVLLAYLIAPIDEWLRRRIPAFAAAAVIVAATLILFWGLATLVYGNIVELNADIPRLFDRARAIAEKVRAYLHAHLPRGLLETNPGTGEAEARVWDTVRASLRILASSGALVLAEAFLVGVYLVFLLIELRRLPRRIQAAFEPERAAAALNIIARINTAMTGYLRAKTISSLASAIPTTIVLWALGVPYPVMWGVLTFFGNFIPYVGGLVAFSFPMMLAFLELEPVWRTLCGVYPVDLDPGRDQQLRRTHLDLKGG